MSHELEFVAGRASVISVGETPWHKEGIVLPTAPSYSDALKLANLTYPVVKVPLFRQVANEEYVQSENGFATVRTDQGRELGVVGPDYTVVQNHEAFAVLEPLVDKGLALIETGGVLRKGADAWLMVRWNIEQFPAIVREVFAKEVVPFSVVTTNHTGRRGVTCRDTHVRIVCANTLDAAEREKSHNVKVRHSANAQTRLIDAAEKMWGALIERTVDTAEAYRKLRATAIDRVTFQRLVIDALVGDPRLAPGFDYKSPRAQGSIDRYHRAVARLEYLRDHGKGHVGNGSAWEAYNGAVEALDHDTETFRSRGNGMRLASLLDGDLARKKALVMSNLLSV